MLRIDICEHCAAKISAEYILDRERAASGPCALCWREGAEYEVATYTLSSRRVARARRVGAGSPLRTTARRAEYKGNWRDFE